MRAGWSCTSDPSDIFRSLFVRHSLAEGEGVVLIHDVFGMRARHAVLELQIGAPRCDLNEAVQLGLVDVEVR